MTVTITRVPAMAGLAVTDLRIDGYVLMPIHGQPTSRVTKVHGRAQCPARPGVTSGPRDMRAPASHAWAGGPRQAAPEGVGHSPELSLVAGDAGFGCSGGGHCRFSEVVAAVIEGGV